MNRRSFLGGLLALPFLRFLKPRTATNLTLLDVAKIHEPKTLPVVEALQSSDQTSIWLIDWGMDGITKPAKPHYTFTYRDPPKNWLKRSIRGI